jgi:hypothetical protein
LVRAGLTKYGTGVHSLLQSCREDAVITNAQHSEDKPNGALSRGGVWVRLPAERWQHIATEHPELAGLRAAVLEAIANSDYVLEGSAGELLAVRMLDSPKALVVAYREVESWDGFVITAFVTSRVAALFKRRRQLWPSSN